MVVAVARSAQKVPSLRHLDLGPVSILFPVHQGSTVNPVTILVVNPVKQGIYHRFHQSLPHVSFVWEILLRVLLDRLHASPVRIWRYRMWLTQSVFVVLRIRFRISVLIGRLVEHAMRMKWP